jgi:hypothetical protein
LEFQNQPTLSKFINDLKAERVQVRLELTETIG